jgi:hypothetical protein
MGAKTISLSLDDVQTVATSIALLAAFFWLLYIALRSTFARIKAHFVQSWTAPPSVRQQREDEDNGENYDDDDEPELPPSGRPIRRTYPK